MAEQTSEQTLPSVTSRSRSCPCCQSDETASSFVASDHHVGKPRTWSYGECNGCGTFYRRDDLSVAELADLYDDSYGSFLAGPSRNALRYASLLVTLAARRRESLVRRLLENRIQMGLLAVLRRDYPRKHRILDVGSGGGTLVRNLQACGYKSARGIDPFLSDGQRDKYVSRGSIEKEAGRWDVILFNHSLEHMDYPTAALAAAGGCLAPNGEIIVRVPCRSSMAAETFRQHWYQLDAPRHAFLPSQDGLELIAASAGLRVVTSWRDSVSLPIVVSQWYAQGAKFSDIPKGLMWRLGAFPGVMTRTTEALNRAGKGDQIVMVLQRPS